MTLRIAVRTAVPITPRAAAPAAVLAALALVASSGAQAQPWPSKPVRIAVGFAPGGSVDLVGRIVAQRLAEQIGQPVIVENRAGAAGNIAAEFVARAPADGYTLLVSSGGALGTNSAIYARMPYDPLKDLAPIALLVYQGNVLLVNPSVPARTVKEFIALARSRPGLLNYGSGGTGSSQHLSAELLSSMAGVKMVHVPYKGGAPAMADLLGGQIDLLFQTIPEAIQQVRAGRVRALGVTGAQRSAVLADVPTIAEAGLPGFEFSGWMGAAGPAGLARDLVLRLNAELNKVLADRDARVRLVESGLDVAGGSPEQLAAHMREQSARMVEFAKRIGLKPVD